MLLLYWPHFFSPAARPHKEIFCGTNYSNEICGFTETNGDWSLGLSDTILFDKNDYHLRADIKQQIHTMASRLATTGITHSRLEVTPIIMAKTATTKCYRLSALTAWQMHGPEGANIPRTNLTTRGLGKKCPIASNDAAKGRAENRRVTVVISTP